MEPFAVNCHLMCGSTRTSTQPEPKGESFMSIESAKAFIERMKTDSEFASKVTACVDAQARMALVRAAGFDFTAQEIGGLRQELTDEDLGKVAAGDLIWNGTDWQYVLRDPLRETPSQAWCRQWGIVK
jgi:predicted ribosomally synthesized peptide with nif11-like leader